MDKIHGGILTLSLKGGEIHDISFEISNNKTNLSFDINDFGEIIVNIKTNTDVILSEFKQEIDMSDTKQIKALEDAAAAMLEQNIESVIKKVEMEYNSDIFGFGNMIYKKNPKLWAQLSPKWDMLFPALQVEVESKVTIINSVMIETRGE
ncbi:Spore germination protein B3 [bioreactor metagenome]|uniref:Spore germination protein B3 n=1 Tax=bioreactor metagenome TaxID=1076179 RepID=A0A645JJC9_9ZZZZ